VTAVQYEIRVTGTVPDSVLEEIEDVAVVSQPVESILRGAVDDQAALHTMITRLQRLGLELIEVRRVSP